MNQANNDSTTLLFIRHTDVHNPQDILYGRLPRFRLSDLGLEQAEATAAALAEEPIGAFYSSPRLRARQTARIIAAPHPDATLRITRLLDEVRTSWQGRPHTELEAHSFNFYHNRLHPSDEYLEDVWERVQQFVSKIRNRHPGETVAGVTHGDLVILARAGYLRMPVEIGSIRRPNIYPGKGSITRLTFPANLRETYPISVEYYDPNEHSAPWSKGWMKLEEGKGLAEDLAIAHGKAG